MGKAQKNPAEGYTDKYGAVDTTAWQNDINKLSEREAYQVTVRRKGDEWTKTRYRNPRKTAQQGFNQWSEENKYKQQTLNQQVMAGSAQNENIANTNVNELDTAKSDNVDPAVTSVGKKKKAQGSLSTSLGL